MSFSIFLFPLCSPRSCFSCCLISGTFPLRVVRFLTDFRKIEVSTTDWKSAISMCVFPPETAKMQMDACVKSYVTIVESLWAHVCTDCCSHYSRDVCFWIHDSAHASKKLVRVSTGQGRAKFAAEDVQECFRGNTSACTHHDHAHTRSHTTTATATATASNTTTHMLKLKLHAGTPHTPKHMVMF